MSFVGVATFLGIDVATAAGLAGVDIAAADVGAGLAGAGAVDLGAAGLGTAGLTGLDAGLGFGAAADAAAGAAGASGLASGLGGVGILGGLAGTGADLAGTAGAWLGAGAADAGLGFGALADTAAADAAATGLASGTSSIAGGLSTAFPTDLASLALQPTSLPGEATTGVQPSTFGGSTGAAPTAATPTPGISAPAGPSAATASAPAGVSSPFGATPDPTSATATIPGGSGTIAPTGTAPVSPTASLTAPQSPGIASLTGTNPNEAIPGAAGYTSVGGAPLTGGSTADTSSIFGSLGDKALDAVTKNPLGTALGAAGLGYSIYNGQKLTSNQQALTAAAQQEAASGQQVANEGQSLTQYLQNGTLPPAYQAQVDQAIQSQIQTAISNAAAAGQPTDPTKNSSLAQTIASIKNQAPILQSELATQLASSGTSLISAGLGAAGLSGQLYSTLVQNDTQAAANTGKAIANLASALNGKSPGTSAGGITISTG